MNGYNSNLTKISVLHFISTRVSNELGAGRPAAAKLAASLVMTIAVIEGLLVATVLVLIRNVWGYAYSNEQEVVKYVADVVPIISVSSFLDGLQCVLSGSYFIIIYNRIFFYSVCISFHLTPATFQLEIIELESNDCKINCLLLFTTVGRPSSNSKIGLFCCN